MAITQPAAAAGSRVEDDLVQVLLDETGDRAAGEIPAAGTAGAGALPLLSHALDQAWRGRGPDTDAGSTMSGPAASKVLWRAARSAHTRG